MNGIESIESDIVLRWTMLLHKEDIESAYSILRRLKFDNYTIEKVGKLIKYYNINIDTTPQCVKRVVSIVGEEMFLKLIKIKKAIFNAEVSSYLTLSKIQRIPNLKNNMNSERKKLIK